MLLEPNWTARSYGKGAGLILILVFLPIWIRVPLMIGLAGELVRIGVHRLWHSFDSKPDFTIGPEGIGSVGFYNKFTVVPWDHIERVVYEHNGIRITRKIDSGNWLLQFLTAGEYGTIVYSNWFFERHPREIMKTLSLYRPDLTKDFNPNS